jgi:hypothetical protein
MSVLLDAAGGDVADFEADSATDAPEPALLTGIVTASASRRDLIHRRLFFGAGFSAADVSAGFTIAAAALAGGVTVSCSTREAALLPGLASTWDRRDPNQPRFFGAGFASAGLAMGFADAPALASATLGRVGDGFSFGKVTFPDGALLEDVSVSGFQRDPNQPLPFSCLGLLSTVGVTGAVAAAAATGVFDDDLPPRAAALASDVGAICFAACVSFSGCRLDPNHPVFFGAATSGFPGAFAALDADASRCCGVSGAGLLADAAGFPDSRRENHPRFLLGAAW